MRLSSNLIGQRIGDYRIDALLGEGGMGVVYRGIQDTLGQIVAIKMLHPELLQDEKIKSRFVREAQALARLNHPNIVRLINFLNREDTCFIVMEYIEGKTLDRMLAEKGIIPPGEAAEYFSEVLAAMHYAHSLGIIHRDIKPSNMCVLDNTGMVKVLDFGTAKMLGAQRLTQEGMTLGTLIYMSPEQICGRELDHRSDIYSLGVTLYEMVTGKLPHDHQDEMELVRAIARGVPQPPSAHYKHLPKRLEQTIMRAIEKDPAKRFQTAEEFLRDIREYQDEEKLKARKLTPPSGLRAIVAEPGLAPAPEQPAKVVPVREAPPGVAAAATTGGGGGVFYALSGVLLLAGLAAAGIFAFNPMPGVPVLVPVLAALAGGIALAALFGFLGFKRGAPAAGAAAPPAPAVAPFPPPLPANVPAQAGVSDSTIGAPEPKGVPSQAAPPHIPAAPPMPGAAAYLHVVEGADKGRSWPLPHGAITIGRGPHNTIVLNDPGVSTSHAQIGFDGTGFVLADLQSRNGCYINSQRVQRERLRNRDLIVFGTTQIAVSIAGS